jgi:Rrf2 family protein
MQLPIKAHYATIAMLALAVRYDVDELSQARNIAHQHAIPAQFLGQILQQLRAANLIISVRGSSGGFKLAAPPADISLAAIIEAVGAASASEIAPSSDDPVVQAVSEVWHQLNHRQLQFLSQLNLADLVQRLEREPATMFFI